MISYAAKNLGKIDTYSLPHILLHSLLAITRITILAVLHFSARKNPGFGFRQTDATARRTLHLNYMKIEWASWGRTRESRSPLSIDRPCWSKVKLSRLNRESPILERLRVWEKKERE